MEKFIVSARKYRPANFVGLIGQESIATTLKNSIKRGQLAHAYLFCGPRGVGKTSTARIFAKTINCMNPGADLEPCGECESCISFAQGRSYCIHELDAASNNSVDDIRLLTEKVMIPPQVGKYSVYIIDEVHMLTTSAFNAFLKTLEEPPAHAIFILATTEKHKILPTILSRCQTYDFNRISVEDIVKNLTSIAKQEGIKADSESLHVIAQKADGAMRVLLCSRAAFPWQRLHVLWRLLLSRARWHQPHKQGPTDAHKGRLGLPEQVRGPCKALHLSLFGFRDHRRKGQHRASAY